MVAMIPLTMPYIPVENSFADWRVSQYLRDKGKYGRHTEPWNPMT